MSLGTDLANYYAVRFMWLVTGAALIFMLIGGFVGFVLGSATKEETHEQR